MKLDGLWFRHYKGTEYQVVCEAECCENLSPQVVYRDRDGRTWIRNKFDFMSSLPGGKRRFAPMVSDAPKDRLNVCELRREEAVIAIQVYDGSIETTEHPLVLERGRLEFADEGGLFVLSILHGTTSNVPEGFFVGKFNIRYSNELDTVVDLKGCEVNNPQSASVFRLAGTFESSTLSYT